jgi:L-threonylcarbamoyladenylate synthase
MALLPLNDANVERAAQIVRAGGLAAFPTETVYGLGADAFNAKALARVFEVKKRPLFDPLIVHVSGLPALERLVDFSKLSKDNFARLEKLSKIFWPGPLTLVLPKLNSVPDLATGGLNTVAVRFPNHSAALSLIKKSTGAIAAPSANPFGYLSPTRAIHVERMLGEKVDIILDGGCTIIGLESTVIDISQEPLILRHGGIPVEEIKDVLGNIIDDTVRNDSPRSPGQLPEHYAPQTPLMLFERGMPAENFFDKYAYLFFSKAEYTAPLKENIFFLSGNGNFIEAAARLFELLHEIDRRGFSGIVVEKAPEFGLGRAINDRLSRAARPF